MDNLSNLSLSKDQIEEPVDFKPDGLGTPDHASNEGKDQSDKYFDRPMDLLTQISIGRKEQCAEEHNDILRIAFDLIQAIQTDTKTENEHESKKLKERTDKLIDCMNKIQENFDSLTNEFDKMTHEHQKSLISFDKKPSVIPQYIKEGFGEQDSNIGLFNEVKSKIDNHLKNQLSDLTHIISELEQKQEHMEHNARPDPIEKKKVKNEIESKLKQLQGQSQILELSGYIDALNSRNLTREDQGKLAFIEDKLNQSKVMGTSELYMTDIYPDENIDLSKNYSRILPDGGDDKDFEEDKFDLPALRTNRLDSNDTLLSALNDVKSVRFDNYEISVSDMMEINSLLQSNFYKSLDNFTHFQTLCLKKNLSSPITKEEKSQNEFLISKLKDKSITKEPEHQKIAGDENSLIFMISLLQQIFKSEMGLDIVISGKSSESDMDKIGFITNGENKLYKIHLLDQDYDNIIDHPISFEKFNSEIKFYIASALKLDPNLIRVVRIKKEEPGTSVDLDIRALNLTEELFQKEKEIIEKRFGAIKFEIYSCMKKFNLSLDDFAFDYNMQYGNHSEIMNRGGYPYYIPGNNWRRIGLNVLEKYRSQPPFNDNWLAGHGTGCWAVAYHGLRYEGAEKPLYGIMEGGFSRGWSNYHDDKEFQLDVSPNVVRIENDCIENENQVRVFVAEKLIDGVERTYEEIGCGTTSDKPWVVSKIGHFNYLRPHPIEMSGKTTYVLIAFQCRINPAAIRIPNLQRDYMIINGPDNVRAYGIMMKEVSKDYYDQWNKKYDYMGRYYQTEDIIYTNYYKVLEEAVKIKMIEDFSILGHKRTFPPDYKALITFKHIYNRGNRIYNRPSAGWIRLGLNVDKLYGHIDWRSRLTRGLKIETEWPVGYMLFDCSQPDCYKNLKDEVEVYTSFIHAERLADDFKYENQTYKVLIQVRYNPRNAKEVTDHLVVPKLNVLPYGILVKCVTIKGILKIQLGRIAEEEDLTKKIDDKIMKV